MDSKDIKKMEKALEAERKRVQALMWNDVDSGTQAKIAKMVCEIVEEDENDRGEYLNKISEIVGMYEGLRENPKTDPFPDAADVKTMVLAGTVEILHSKLHPQVYNPSLMYWRAGESSDVGNVDNVDRFMQWDAEKGQMNWFSDRFTYDMILEGTVPVKAFWTTEWRWVQKRVPKSAQIAKKFIDGVQNMMGFDGSESITHDDYSVEWSYEKFEYPDWEMPNVEDVGFPTFSVPGGDESKLEHIWHRTRPTVEKIKDKETQGYFINTEILQGKAREMYAQEGQTAETRMSSEGTVLPGYEYYHMRCEVIEMECAMNVPGRGYHEVIIWVDKKTETFLGMMPLVHLMRDGKRNWVIGQFIPRKNRMFGKSIGDFIIEQEKEMNTMHNQRIDMVKMAIIPPGLYRAAAGITPEEIHLQPGIWIPVDDVDDVKYLQMPNNVLPSFQEERMILELVERVTSVGSYQAGQESSVNRTRATARGTMAIIAQGEQRGNTLASRIKFALQKVIKLRLKLWQQNIPAGLADRVLGKDGNKLFPKGLSVMDIAGDYDVYLETDPYEGSRSVERELHLNLYSIMLENPFVAQNPAGLWELTSRVFKAHGEIDPTKIIGPKPPEASPEESPQTVQEEIDAIRQGRMLETKPGTDIVQVVAGLLAYKDSPQGRSLPKEHAALIEVRVAKLISELVEMRRKSEEEQETLADQLSGAAPLVEGGLGGVPGGLVGAPQEDVGAGLGGELLEVPGGAVPEGFPPSTNRPPQGF